MTLKARVWFSVFVLLVFVSGGATALLLHRYIDPAFEAGAEEPPAPPEGRPGRGRASGPPPMVPKRFAADLARDLQLTDTQRQQLETILERGRERLDGFRDQVHARFEQERRQVNSEIEAILTPAQRDRFAQFQKRMRARRPPPPHGRGRGRDGRGGGAGPG